MAHGSGNRLLLRALVKGLGEAVRRNDQSAAERYRGRLRLAADRLLPMIQSEMHLEGCF